MILRVMAFYSSTTPSLLLSPPSAPTMDSIAAQSLSHLDTVDPKIHDLIEHEKHRQSHSIKLIASKNFTSAIMEVLNSPFTTSIPYMGVNVQPLTSIASSRCPLHCRTTSGTSSMEVSVLVVAILDFFLIMTMVVMPIWWMQVNFLPTMSDHPIPFLTCNLFIFSFPVISYLFRPAQFKPAQLGLGRARARA